MGQPHVGKVAERIAELRSADVQLHKAYRLTRDILQSSPLGIQVVTGLGTVAYVNPAMCAIAGLDRESFQTVNIFDSPMYAANDIRARIRSVLMDGTSFTAGPFTVVEHFAKRPTVVNYTGIPMEDEDGRNALVFVEDITEKSRLEEEMFKSQKLESIGLLAGGIAHDFNNLLSIILSNISLSKHHATQGDGFFDALTETEEAATRARYLTQQLLVFSRGGLPVKQVVDAAELVRETVDFSLRGARCLASYDFEPGLWSVELDKGQMHQVIQNLAINAEQAMPDGGTIVVSARNRSVTFEDSLPLTPGRYIRISIADEGEGILPEHLPKIFDPYFTTKSGGNGLGLAVAYSVVKKHNGYLAVASMPGKGTAFQIHLPASDRTVLKSDNRDCSVARGKGRILVMDDEELVRRALVRVLTELGYEVEVAADGARAIELYNERREMGRAFDLLVLDLIVPGGMGGQRTIEKIRELVPDVKAVVSSGYSTDPIMSEYEKYGFIDVVAKPYDMRQLSEVIHRAMRKD